MLAAGDAKTPRSGATVATLALALLCAMAFAIPAAPIEGGEGGLLVGHSQFSEAMAETLSQAGYAYLALDLAGASTAGDALWRDHLDRVRRRRFPIWGWIDTRMDPEIASDLTRSLFLDGLYVYGPDAVRVAAALRGVKPGGNVVPVLGIRDPRPPEGDYAVAMDYDTFIQNAGIVARPVLIADQLDPALVLDARRAVDGACLVAQIPLLD